MSIAKSSEISASSGKSFEDAVEKALEIALEGGHRSAEFVGDLTNQPQASLLGLVERRRK